MVAAFVRLDGEDLILAVRLTPRSARDAIGGAWEDEKGARWLQAQVRAVPEKGLANRALIRLIAKRVHIPAKDIRIESGDTARLKRLRLAGWAGAVERVTSELDGK